MSLSIFKINEAINIISVSKGVAKCLRNFLQEKVDSDYSDDRVEDEVEGKR